MSGPNLYQKITSVFYKRDVSTLVLPGIFYFKGEAVLTMTPVVQETALWQKTDVSRGTRRIIRCQSVKYPLKGVNII